MANFVLRQSIIRTSVLIDPTVLAIIAMAGMNGLSRIIADDRRNALADQGVSLETKNHISSEGKMKKTVAILILGFMTFSSACYAVEYKRDVSGGWPNILGYYNRNIVYSDITIRDIKKMQDEIETLKQKLDDTNRKLERLEQDIKK